MAAGKNYLKTTKPVPAALPIYYNADGSIMSMTVTDIVDGSGNPAPAFVNMVPVMIDDGGAFIDAPLDPASVSGLSDWVQ